MSAFEKLPFTRARVSTPTLLPTTRVALLLIAVSGLAGAATQTATCTSITNLTTDLSAQAINCSQFNPATGTLTSVTITISGSIAGSITLTNNAAGSEAVIGSTSASFELHTALNGFSFPAGPVPPNAALFNATLQTGTPPGTTVTLASGGSQSFNNLVSGVSTIGPMTDSNTATFAPYEGTGTFPITFDTVTSLSITGGGGNVSETQSTTASANVTVVYTFSPAPPSMTCSGTNSGTVGAAFSSPAPTVTGGTPPYTFSIVSGTLPNGLNLNTATGAVTGTPTVPGSFSIGVKDSTGAAATTTCPIVIGSLQLTCNTTASGTVGTAFDSPALSVTGGTPPYTFSVASGTLPNGLTLNTATGEIKGTPTAPGSFTIEVTDSTGLVSTGTCAYFFGMPSTTCPVPAYKVKYASNLNIGESYIDITNPGTDGAPLQGPGLGPASGNICVNVYAFDPGEELIACCSCLVTPDQTVNLGVNRDLTTRTLTGVIPTSVTVKLVATLAGPGGAGTSCTNSAAFVTTETPACGLDAWGTTLHATPGGSFGTTETPFTPATLSTGELATLNGRCASIVGNASGFGICNSCRAGALGAAKQ